MMTQYDPDTRYIDKMAEARWTNTARDSTVNMLDMQLQNTKSRIDEIATIFANIRNMLFMRNNTESLLAEHYAELKKSIDEFESLLISEAVNEVCKPIETAKKLEATVYTVANGNTKLEEKMGSINDFRDHARNGKYSQKQKIVIGAVIGGLIMVGLFAACVTPLLLPVMLGLSVGLVVLTTALATIAGGFGAMMGALFAEDKKQDDSRGFSVTKNLRSLVTERNRLFQCSNKNKCEQVVETKDRVVEPVLRRSTGVA
jgi:hypothetical protein